MSDSDGRLAFFENQADAEHAANNTVLGQHFGWEVFEIGLVKYGVTVAEIPLPLKEWLEHAYTETLDKAVYLKRAIQEMEDAQ